MADRKAYIVIMALNIFSHKLATWAASKNIELPFI